MHVCTCTHMYMYMYVHVSFLPSSSLCGEERKRKRTQLTCMYMYKINHYSRAELQFLLCEIFTVKIQLCLWEVGHLSQPSD